MLRFLGLSGFVVLLALCSGCSFFQTEPTREQKLIVSSDETALSVKHKLGIIGSVEPVYIFPMENPFEARIDTGAEISSIDASQIKRFERDGEKWVSFTLKNRTTGETHTFEKKILKITSIKRIYQDEERLTVQMKIKFGTEIISAPFTLADRSKFNYQILIGRNVLNGLAVVDPAISNTLR